MYKCILGIIVLFSATLAVAVAHDGDLISMLDVNMLQMLIAKDVDIDFDATQAIANVSISSVVWLFSFSLVGFALFVNRRKV